MTLIKKASTLLATSLLFVSCGDSQKGVPLAGEARASESPAKTLYDAGYAAESSGNVKKALKSYGTINNKFPHTAVAPEATFRYAKLLERSGEPLDAFQAYDDVLTKYPASSHYSEAMKRQETLAHQVAQGIIKDSFIGFNTSIGPKATTEMLAKVRDNAPRASSAPKAQFAIGEVFEKQDNKESEAISSYRKLVRDYSNSNYAPEAQYRIGNILLRQASEGNEDAANIDRARKAFDDLLLRYPNHPRAADAKRAIAKIKSDDIRRSYDIAEFYRKKGQTNSALFYYRETVRKSKDGALRAQAQGWINKLGS